MKLEVEVDDEVLDEYIQRSLKESYDNFNVQQVVSFVSADKEVEQKFIKKMKKALRLVHNYYSVEADHIKKDID